MMQAKPLATPRGARRFASAGGVVYNESMTTIDLMGTHDAAVALGVTRSTVLTLVLKTALTPVGRIGKRQEYVFDAAEVRALAKERADDQAL